MFMRRFIGKTGAADMLLDNVVKKEKDQNSSRDPFNVKERELGLLYHLVGDGGRWCYRHGHVNLLLYELLYLRLTRRRAGLKTMPLHV